MSNTLKIKLLTALTTNTASHATGETIDMDAKSAVRYVRTEQATAVGFKLEDYDGKFLDSVVEESTDASVVKDDDAPTDDEQVFEADETADDDDSDVEVVDIETNETADDDDSVVETREE